MTTPKGLLAVCAALAACATPLTLKRDTALGLAEGVVLLRVATNDPIPWTSVWMQAQPGGTSYEISAVSQGENSSRIFAAALPAGRYRLTRMQASRTYGRVGATELDATIADPDASFRIEASRVTNLATVIPQSTGPAVKELIPFSIVREATPVPTGAVLAALAPKVGPTVADRPELGWDTAPDPRHNEALLSFARSRANPLNGPVFARSGELFAGTRMGRILAAAPSGQAWRSLHTRTPHEILAVLPLDSGLLLVAGEEGFVALTRDSGGTWTRVSGFGAELSVFFLGVLPSGELLAAARAESEIRVYTSARPELGWRERTRLVLRRPSEKPCAALSRSRLVIAASLGEISSYDFAAERWQTESAAIEFSSLQATADGFVYAVPSGRPAIFGSSDWGKTWNGLGAALDGAQPVFAQRSTGYAAAARPPAAGGIALLKTTDGAQSWTEIGRVEFWPNRLLLDPARRTLVATTIANQTFVSSDEGHTWRELE